MSPKIIKKAADELLRLTKLDKVTWKGTHSQGTFQTEFGGVNFVLFNTGRVFALSAIGDSGSLIESLIASPSEEADYRLLEELYGLVEVVLQKNGERLTGVINQMISTT